MTSLSLTRPHALIMVGIPGSGKTSFATQFSETFSAPLIEIDKLAAFTKDDVAAQELTAFVLANFMKTNQSLIIDAYTESRRSRTELAKYCRDHGYTPLLIWVQVDTETAKRRSLRKQRLSQESFEKSMEAFSPPHALERPLVISGKHTYATQAKTVLKRLSAPRAEIAKQKQAPTRPGQIKVL